MDDHKAVCSTTFLNGSEPASCTLFLLVPILHLGMVKGACPSSHGVIWLRILSNSARVDRSTEVGHVPKVLKCSCMCTNHIVMKAHTLAF